MKTHLIKRLFEIIGYSLISLFLVQVGFLFHSHWISSSAHLNHEPIHTMAWSGTLIKTLAITLFCFLMKLVLQIIDKRSTESLAKASTVMKWSVSCFLLSATLTMFSPLWIWSHTDFMGLNAMITALNSLDAFLMFLKIFIGFLSDSVKDILIALSIAILFKYFEESIIFESEVA